MDGINVQRKYFIHLSLATVKNYSFLNAIELVSSDVECLEVGDPFNQK